MTLSHRPCPIDAAMPARTTHRPVPAFGEVRQPTRAKARRL
ncbi:hypothetical protein [Aureimonas psammosilenae]|nr:hypothetical protein [Aureimonas psammosilenae]